MTALEILAALVGIVLGYAVLSWLFPPLLTPLWRTLLHVTYRFRVHGTEHIPTAGPALIVCNHVSAIDWLVIWAACPRRVKFVRPSGLDRKPLLAFLLSWSRHRSIRIGSQAGYAEAIAAELDHGEVVCVFPEGRLTRNGQMRPFGRWIERVLKSTARDVPVIPACTAGLWGSLFSHKDGPILRKWPEGFRRAVSVWFAHALPKTANMHVIRAAVAEAQADLAVRDSDEVLPVPRWYVWTASRWTNVFRPAFVDVATGTERRLSCGAGLVACWCLASWLKKRLALTEEPNPRPPSLREKGETEKAPPLIGEGLGRGFHPPLASGCRPASARRLPTSP